MVLSADWNVQAKTTISRNNCLIGIQFRLLVDFDKVARKWPKLLGPILDFNLDFAFCSKARAKFAISVILVCYV